MTSANFACCPFFLLNLPFGSMPIATIRSSLNFARAVKSSLLNGVLLGCVCIHLKPQSLAAPSLTFLNSFNLTV